MRILFVINGLIGGGAEKLINDMLPIINETECCDLLILSDKDEKYLENLKTKGVKVEVMPPACNSHLRRMRYLRDYLKKNHYDIVHANCFPTIYYCALIKKSHGKYMPKLIMTEHNTSNRRRHIRLLRPVERYIYSAYDHVISISDATQDALIRWLKPKDTSKFCVIENGIPLDDYANAKAVSPKELYHEWKTEDILLCMIGSFTEQKNHVRIVEVMKRLPNRYHLILLGEGPLQEEIEEMVKAEKLTDRVHFMGFRKDVSIVVKTCDVVVIPSKWEGFGLIAVEAMAAGKPIVCNDVPGLREVVGDCALKVKDAKTDAFVEAILSLENLEIYQKYSSDSLIQAKKFDIVDMTNKYLSLYEQRI